jgi:hypothetical protein
MNDSSYASRLDVLDVTVSGEKTLDPRLIKVETHGSKSRFRVAHRERKTDVTETNDTNRQRPF